MKKIISMLMSMCLIIGAISSVSAIEAAPTISTVLVDGREVAFDAYNVDGNNYFKLRDVAYVLSGTSKQFDVGYDAEANTITLISGKAYTVVGGEMAKGGSEMSEINVTDSQIIKDGSKTQLSAYNINGNNYFKLRDLGEKFNFGVDYNADTNSVTIDSEKTYSDEESEYGGNFLTPTVPSKTPEPGLHT